MPDDTSDPRCLARIAQRKAIQRRRRAARRAASTKTAPTAHRPPGLSPTQQLGRQAEAQAEKHLTAAGVKVLKRNLLCRAGEIDLVCLDSGVLAFVEVRQRYSRRFGGAAASVG